MLTGTAVIAVVFGLLEILGSSHEFTRMRGHNAVLQESSDTRCRASDADKYTFIPGQKSKMIKCAKPIDQSWPEIGLAAVAKKLATRIEESAAWKDAALDPHRLVFNPRDEADEVRQHALRIAAVRSQVGDDPAGDSDVHRQAHTLLAREREVLDALVQPLRERVVALWAYAEKVDELSSQIAALRSIEKAMAVSPELEALARQTGADELATDQLGRLTADAETISAQITAATEFLTNTLRVY